MSVRMISKGIGWLVLITLLAGNLMVAAKLHQAETPLDSREDAYDNFRLFTEVVERIRHNYVDSDKTAYKDLVYGALKGMLSSLDEHSQFMDPEMYQSMQDDTAGHFGGLGIVISVRDNVLTIINPMEDTPGWQAGLESNDKIVEIDGESTEGVTLQEAVKKLRGEPGTKVTLRVLRPKSQEFLSVDIVRDIINVPSVKGTKMVEPGVGYVRIVQFNNPTAKDLQKELDSLFKQGMEALILDLRGNPGGLLSAAIEVSQKFLPKSDLVVFTQGRGNRPEQRFTARGRHHYKDLPMVILVNGGSASASEIVSGALKDHNRAVLVGERTFGKGSVQSVLPLEDESAIRLTTAKYYTPSEQVIHDVGIEPDVLVPMATDKLRLIFARESNIQANPSLMDESVENLVDVQLERALNVVKGVMMFEAHNETVVEDIQTAQSK